jgi:hypothetical protein
MAMSRLLRAINVFVIPKQNNAVEPPISIGRKCQLEFVWEPTAKSTLEFVLPNYL